MVLCWKVKHQLIYEYKSKFIYSFLARLVCRAKIFLSLIFFLFLSKK